MVKIKLQSCDGKVFSVDYRSAKLSSKIKYHVERTGLAKSQHIPIRLEHVGPETLEKVIQWCDYHQRNPFYTGKIKRLPVDLICDWDVKYFDNIEYHELIDIANAANYLDIRGLCYVVTKQFIYKSGD